MVSCGFRNALNLVVGHLWLTSNTNPGMIMCVCPLVCSSFCVLVTRLYHPQQIDHIQRVVCKDVHYSCVSSHSLEKICACGLGTCTKLLLSVSSMLYMWVFSVCGHERVLGCETNSFFIEFISWYGKYKQETLVNKKNDLFISNV